MPRNPAKTIVTTVAGDKESLAAARLENLKKAREKALELRLLRSKQPSTSSAPPTNKTRKRIQAEPVASKPIDAALAPETPQAHSGSDRPEDVPISEQPGEQPTRPRRGRPPGSGKRKQESVPSGDLPVRSDGAETGGREKSEKPRKVLRGESGEGDANITDNATGEDEQEPQTPPGNVSNVATPIVPETVEEGELDPSPAPPTELPRGRSKNNRRKPTTVQRRRTRPPSVDTVRRRLQFDHMHVPVGGGAFYRNNASGHFTFSR